MQTISYPLNKSLDMYLREHINLDLHNFMESVTFGNVVADLFISNVCNLKCKHCYFGSSHNHFPQLTITEWQDAVNVLYDAGVRHFHISGKESSLCMDTLNIIRYIKEQYNDVFLGVVSNGTGSFKYYDTLINSQIDYLEISIDGLKNTHDYIRGDEVFDKILALVSKIMSKNIDIINIATCINQLNKLEYITLLDNFHQLGIKRFFLTPFVETGNGKQFSHQSINSRDLTQLVHKIVSFINENKNYNCGLCIKLCLTKEWTNKCWKESASIRKIICNYIENNGSLIYRSNGNVFQITFNFFDIDYYRNMSITNDGFVIPESDKITSYEDYSLESLCNIRNVDSTTLTQIRYNNILKQLENERF